jgi:phosphatidate cytidylyltransferase
VRLADGKARRGITAGRPAGQTEREDTGGRPPGQTERGVPTATAERRPISTGRNLPAALAVAVGLGGLVLLTLFTVKATFLLYVGIIVGLAVWELTHAFAARGIRVPLEPVIAGGVAMVTLAYWIGPKPAIVAVALTAIAVLAWRLPAGADGFVRDVTAGVFAVAYLPLLAVFVALMLAEPDGARRCLLFVILAACSDTFGYLAGILTGRHPMAPSISPNKTWEGFGGSAIGCLAGGAIGMVLLLHGHVWQGLLLGAAAVAAATLGDLAESMMKRDLKIKDMGHLLPGHGGILDRIDSLLVIAPVAWLLLAVFVQNGHAA